MLLIENSQMQRQTGAAVETFRNEVVSANRAANQVYAATALQRPNGSVLLEGNRA
jgi:hypothetical protein